ncbi:MAG: trypsin-like peptidase domain-containing protein [Alphaproteobacteria bacterium]|nr:trypsin-like peptidase domain-containing protein [Alphaproteobacteria bacterium]
MHPVLLLVALLGAPDALGAERRTPVVVAVERAVPAVVSIDTEVLVQSPFARFGALPFETSSQGSGVIIDPKGVVLTNAHVVVRANAITVHTADGRSFPAEVVGMDTDLDLAVLSLKDASGLTAIPIGSSADLMLGESVIAIGNPYGLGQTVSTGVVSTTARDLEISPGVYQSYVQTDAAINPGNSGGALVNLNGELIGVNTAIRQGAEGIGFAIPVDRAWKVAQDMLTYGSVRAPWLGVDVVTVDQRRLLGTPLAEGAVLVKRVHPGGPAEAAGLKAGDLLYLVDGRPARSLVDLNTYLAERKPGDRVALSVYRGTTPLKVNLATTALPDAVVQQVLTDRLGITVKDASAGGVVTVGVAPTGVWAKAGLKTGDIIIAVNGQAVRNTAELTGALQRAKSQHRPSSTFTIVRGNYRGNLTLDI